MFLAEANQTALAVNQISWLPFIPEEGLDRIAMAYQNSGDSERTELLWKSSKELTGETID